MMTILDGIRELLEMADKHGADTPLWIYRGWRAECPIDSFHASFIHAGVRANTSGTHNHEADELPDRLLLHA